MVTFFKFRLGICRLIVIAVLFSQLAVSAYACPLAGTLLGSTDAPAETESTRYRTPCESTTGGADSEFPGLCAEHCQQSPQYDQVKHLELPPLTLVDLYPILPLNAALLPDRAMPAVFAAIGKPPPSHAILHCCLRI